MRFDVQPLPLGATAHPFNLQAQEALNRALAADYAATYTPVVTPTTPVRQVSCDLMRLIRLLLPTMRQRSHLL
jgi:hypothetical protein